MSDASSQQPPTYSEVMLSKEKEKEEFDRTGNFWSQFATFRRSVTKDKLVQFFKNGNSKFVVFGKEDDGNKVDRTHYLVVNEKKLKVIYSGPCAGSWNEIPKEGYVTIEGDGYKFNVYCDEATSTDASNGRISLGFLKERLKYMGIGNFQYPKQSDDGELYYEP